jgi:hypothetical protein
MEVEGNGVLKSAPATHCSFDFTHRSFDFKVDQYDPRLSRNRRLTAFRSRGDNMCRSIPVSSMIDVDSMRANLIPLKGGRTVSIVRDITVVGRQEGLCDVCIDKSSISKLHCIIVRTDGLLFIRDLGSTNGTKVNGQRVVRGALLPGDELAFASEKFKVEMGPGESENEDEEVHSARTEMLELAPAREEYFATRNRPEDEVDSERDLRPNSDSDVRLLPEE